MNEKKKMAAADSWLNMCSQNQMSLPHTCTSPSSHLAGGGMMGEMGGGLHLIRGHMAGGRGGLAGGIQEVGAGRGGGTGGCNSKFLLGR